MKQFSEMEEDAMQELGNIASGQALSVMDDHMSEHVHISRTQVDWLQRIEDASQSLERVEPGDSHVAVYIQIENVDGAVILDMDEASSMRLVDLAGGEATGQFSDAEQELLEQIGGELAEEYAAGIKQFIGMELSCGPAQIAFKSPDTLLYAVANRVFQSTDTQNGAFLIHTPFNIGTLVEGQLMFMLPIQRVDTFTQKLEDII